MSGNESSSNDPREDLSLLRSSKNEGSRNNKVLLKAKKYLKENSKRTRPKSLSQSTSYNHSQSMK